MNRIPTLLRTLWYLRSDQWTGRVGRLLGRQWRRVRLAGPPPTLRAAAPAVAFLSSPAHVRWDGGDRLTLLNRELDLSGGVHWDGSPHGPLFAFHLHEHDWLRSVAASPDARWRVLEDWLENHPEGIGWHPANASRRTFAWLKLLMTPGALPAAADTARLRAALADQVATVERHPERLLLANHYLWNLLALVAAGTALDGPDASRWLGFGAALEEQVTEQIPPDGLHYERSPMYHSLLLESILDLLNVAAAAPGRLPEDIHAALRAAAQRMLGALEILTHPDREIALFADSAFGIAHPPDALRALAAGLGIAPRGPKTPGVLDASGYARLEAGPFVLIASAGSPQPSYNPGHAHCDALSFELSVAGRRVVTDTGVYEYQSGERRRVARATASHATIEIDGREQSEVWDAHRIGGRADAGLVKVDPPHVFEGVCAGFATPEVLHRRQIEVTPDAVSIRDTLDAPAPRARLVLPFAPDLEPVLDGSRARVALAQGTLEIDLPESVRFRVERTPYYPEFGRERERAALVGEARDLARAEWRLRLS